MSQPLERPRSERHAKMADVRRGFSRPHAGLGVLSFTETPTGGALSVNCVNVPTAYRRSEDASPCTPQQWRSGASLI
jgi:hypothetical protein